MNQFQIFYIILYILLVYINHYFGLNSIYFILKEEPDLQKRFGEDYKKYKENVPRWIPRWKPWLKLNKQK